MIMKKLSNVDCFLELNSTFLIFFLMVFNNFNSSFVKSGLMESHLSFSFKISLIVLVLISKAVANYLFVGIGVFCFAKQISLFIKAVKDFLLFNDILNK